MKKVLGLADRVVDFLCLVLSPLFEAVTMACKWLAWKVVSRKSESYIGPLPAHLFLDEEDEGCLFEHRLAVLEKRGKVEVTFEEGCYAIVVTTIHHLNVYATDVKILKQDGKEVNVNHAGSHLPPGVYLLSSVSPIRGPQDAVTFSGANKQSMVAIACHYVYYQ